MKHLVVALVVSSMVATTTDATVVTFTDSTFDDTDWQVLVFSYRDTGGALPGGSVQATQQPGGNPGTMRQVRNEIPAAPSPSEFATVAGVHLRAGATYDPSAQGPIGSITYQEDARNFLIGQLSGLAIRQSGRVYYTQAGIHTSTAWGPIVQQAIVPDVFYELTADGAIPESKPDFSAAGAPLEVGFLRASSNGPGAGAYAVVAAIDNWKVKIYPPCATNADCEDGDSCTIDTCAPDGCRTVDTCVVPGPSVRADVLAQGRVDGVTTDTPSFQEKRPPASLTDTARAEAASTSPAGSAGEAAASLAGGLRAQASATLLPPGQSVSVQATASHVRTFDVVSRTGGPPPTTFDVNLLLWADGTLTIRSGVGSPLPLAVSAGVTLRASITDGNGPQLTSFERSASLRSDRFGTHLNVQSFETPTWFDSFGPDSDPDINAITRPVQYSEFVTRTVSLGTPARIAVEMALIADASSTPNVPQWVAISNFFDTASLQVYSTDPEVVLIEVDPAACPGDCDGNGMVTVDELILGVSIALGTQWVAACEAMDVDSDGTITVDELIMAVNDALVGCP